MDDFLKAKGLTPTEKFVAVAMGWFESHKEPGSCWPSEKAIAQATGFSVRTVKRAVASLSRKKKKVRVETWRDSAGKLHNAYYFDVDTSTPANKAKPADDDTLPPWERTENDRNTTTRRSSESLRDRVERKRHSSV
jgi:hypothetical protein